MLQFGTLRSNEHAFVSKSQNQNFKSSNNDSPNTYNNNNHNNHPNTHHNNTHPNQFNKKPHCTYCGKDGHVTNNCFKKQKDKQIMNNNNQNSHPSRHAFTVSYNVPKNLE